MVNDARAMRRQGQGGGDDQGCDDNDNEGRMTTDDNDIATRMMTKTRPGQRQQCDQGEDNRTPTTWRGQPGQGQQGEDNQGKNDVVRMTGQEDVVRMTRTRTTW